MDGQIGFNLDRDGASRCIKAGGYMKAGLGNCLYHPNDGFGVTCVLEYEDYDEEKEAKRKRK